MPEICTVLSPMVALALAPLANVSVVRMASAAACQLSSPLASAGRCVSNMLVSSGSPITPVDAIITASGSQPSAVATPLQQSVTAAMPPAPVKALALPALTRMARGGLPAATRCRHQSTGAAAVSDRVKTAASAVPSPKRIRSMSSRP